MHYALSLHGLKPPSSSEHCKANLESKTPRFLPQDNPHSRVPPEIQLLEANVFVLN